jgi:transposase-like protein
MPRPNFPKSLRQFQQQFASEEACTEYLTACRWPDGFRCPRCSQTSAYGLAGRRRWQCASCRYQVSVTAGTILHNSKTPLTTWFWAAYLMTTDKRGLSALLLQQQWGLRRYETAWMMLHKLRRAMVTQRGTRFAARLRWTRRGSGELRQDCGAVASSEGATPHWFW